MEMGNLTSIYSIAERMTSSNRRKALFCGAEVAGSRMLGERGGEGEGKQKGGEGRAGVSHPLCHWLDTPNNRCIYRSVP